MPRINKAEKPVNVEPLVEVGIAISFLVLSFTRPFFICFTLYIGIDVQSSITLHYNQHVE